MTANIKTNTFHDINVERIEDDVNDENNAIFFSLAQQTAINRIDLLQLFTGERITIYVRRQVTSSLVGGCLGSSCKRVSEACDPPRPPARSEPSKYAHEL